MAHQQATQSLEDLIEGMRDRGTDRQWRLFVCACCRQVWGQMRDKRSQEAVRVGEAFADRGATADQREAAMHDALLAEDGVDEADEDAALRVYQAQLRVQEAATAATFPSTERVTYNEAHSAVDCCTGVSKRGKDEEAEVQRVLFLDIFGKRGRLATVEPAWQTPTVVQLAQAAYDERELPSGHLDPARLAVLADALETAGCMDQEILAHLRGSGPHVRGCWAVDSLLGRSYAWAVS
jgi:hypothetical protein